MALISTDQLFQEYYLSVSKDYPQNREKQLKRQELFDYEKEIGKQLVDMSEDEIVELFSRFKDIRFNTILQIASLYRRAINYYSFNYEPVINHFNKDSMRGMALINRSQGDQEAGFTIDYVEECIAKIRSQYNDSIDKADYLECIVRLFMEGFSHAREIVELKEEDIEFETGRVMVKDRCITLSDRTLYLLKRVHNMESVMTYRNTFLMRTWRGYYFKYPINQRNETTFDNQEPIIIIRIINRKITIDMNKVCEVKLNFTDLYYLGLYRRFIELCGSEEIAQNAVLDEDSKEGTALLVKYIKDNNLSAAKPFFLRQYFRKCM